MDTPTFDEWLAWVFDHPVIEPAWAAWYLQDSAPYLNPPDHIVLEYFTALFENPAKHLQRFTEAQVEQGLHMVMSTAYSNQQFAFLKKTVPLENRLRGLRAFLPLFRDCFAVRCDPGLGHLDEADRNPLNGSCYMWWDTFPYHGQEQGGDNSTVNETCLEIMAACLQIGHVAVQESALHGLGHWAIYDWNRKKCADVIETFLNREKTLRPELVNYARSAQVGYVQ